MEEEKYIMKCEAIFIMSWFGMKMIENKSSTPMDHVHICIRRE